MQKGFQSVNLSYSCAIHALTPRISIEVSGTYELEKCVTQPPSRCINSDRHHGRRWNEYCLYYQGIVVIKITFRVPSHVEANPRKAQYLIFGHEMESRVGWRDTFHFFKNYPTVGTSYSESETCQLR